MSRPRFALPALKGLQVGDRLHLDRGHGCEDAAVIRPDWLPSSPRAFDLSLLVSGPPALFGLSHLLLPTQLSWLHVPDSCPGPSRRPLFMAGRRNPSVRQIKVGFTPVADPSRFFYDLSLSPFWSNHCPSLPPPTWRERPTLKDLQLDAPKWEIKGPAFHSFHPADLLHQLSLLLTFPGRASHSLWVALCRAFISEPFAEVLAFNLRDSLHPWRAVQDLPPDWQAFSDPRAQEAHWRLLEYAGEKLSPWGLRLQLSQGQAWLDSVLSSPWMTSHYPHLSPIRLVPQPSGSGMWACLPEGEIRACRDWLSDGSLLHELSHFLQPAHSLPHGPEFAATLLRLTEQFRPVPVSAWLRQGYSLVGMQVTPKEELLSSLARSGTEQDQERRRLLSQSERFAAARALAT